MSSEQMCKINADDSPLIAYENAECELYYCCDKSSELVYIKMIYDGSVLAWNSQYGWNEQRTFTTIEYDKIFYNCSNNIPEAIRLGIFMKLRQYPYYEKCRGKAKSKLIQLQLEQFECSGGMVHYFYAKMIDYANTYLPFFSSGIEKPFLLEENNESFYVAELAMHMSSEKFLNYNIELRNTQKVEDVGDGFYNTWKMVDIGEYGYSKLFNLNLTCNGLYLYFSKLPSVLYLEITGYKKEAMTSN